MIIARSSRLPAILIGVVALSLAVAAVGSPQNPNLAVVDRIIDGDSLIVRKGGSHMEIRLWGIDAPEYDQPGSRQAKRKLSELVLGNTVSIFIKYTDKYGRQVALLTSSGVNVNEEMIVTGNSWVHDYFCRETICRKWKVLEERARNEKRGLWQEDDPIPPWQWKRKR